MVADVAARLNDRIDTLARQLLGDPNNALSTDKQLRFGSKGSIAIEIAGTNKGRWFDHEHGFGGDGLELVRHVNNLANGAAADWAREWLCLPQGVSIKRSRRSKPRDAGTAAGSFASTEPPATGNRHEGDLAAKVANILASCQAISGTPAERYLRNRGISATTLPASIRFRPRAHGRYDALVALATDIAGRVHALQQIYLTDDGRKAPLKIQKRTNKAHDGWSDVAAVRFPGTAPLILAEGVETALSIWQATGQETWACLGISNIARAPVPDGVPVIVARDGDQPGSKADQHLRRAVAILRDQGRQVVVAEPPIGQDFNDVLRQNGEQAVRDAIAAAAVASSYSATWRKDLIINNEGEPRPVLANAIHALRNAPEWKGVLSHNEFATTTVARKALPWSVGHAIWEDREWSDRDDCLVADWLQRQGIMVPASIAGQAVEVVARDHLFHPVRDYLETLTWDGVPRIDAWLTAYLGAADSPYNRAIGPRWLISAIARIHTPGAQADCALILEGPQGIRKSSALRVLAQPWFTDRLSDLGSKDAAMETKGVWVIEIAELDTMSRADVGTIKAFITRTCDRFRPPYGKRLVDLPRQCVFAGTVNPDGGYLKDPTGGRRFWPVVCGAINIVALERDRDQLWVEARDRFSAGEPWWLDTLDLETLAANEQADRYQGDAWDDLIRNYVEGRALADTNAYRDLTVDCRDPNEPLVDISVSEILEHALSIEKGRWTQADQNRVVRCLTSMGFEQYRARRGGDRERRYRRIQLKEEIQRHPPRGPGQSDLGPGKVRVSPRRKAE